MRCSITTRSPIRSRPARKPARRLRGTMPRAGSRATRERRRGTTFSRSTGNGEGAGSGRKVNIMNTATSGNDTALLVFDPYNDFISDGGKIWDRIRAVAEANDCVPNMLRVLHAARRSGLRVFYALHHRYRPGDYETWKYIAPIQKAAWERKSFEYGTWGGEIRAEFEPRPGDIVAQEHWCSSGFANTDLDLLLKKHGIHQLIVIGMIAHTCVESTVRFAAELGYEVTMVNDATADYNDEMMHTALRINLPNYANAIVSTSEVVDALASVQSLPIGA